jgi:hypothetical protein
MIRRLEKLLERLMRPGVDAPRQRSRIVTVVLLAAAPLLLLRGRAFAQYQQKATGSQKGMGSTIQGSGSPTGAGAPAFRVKFNSLDVAGGTKPGDSVTLKAIFEHSGGSGSKSIPWKIYPRRTFPFR